jgi:trk system potassium uptake protein TrkH
MVVGGSPASTAGGLKTVTFALLLLTAYGILRRRRELEVFGRSLPMELLRRAITLTVLYLGLVVVVTILLCSLMPTYQMIDLLFEACSACGTVGLSTGVTRVLDIPGKIIIIGGMYLGRIGPLTLLLALTSGVRPVRYRYPREHVVIG